LGTADKKMYEGSIFWAFPVFLSRPQYTALHKEYKSFPGHPQCLVVVPRTAETPIETAAFLLPRTLSIA